MYKIKLKTFDKKQDYRFIQVNIDNQNFINIYISIADDCLWLNISESIDGGFNFTDVTKNYTDLCVEEIQNIDLAIEYVKNYFLKNGFKLIN